MDSIEIGRIYTVDTDKWLRFKKRHYKVFDELDYAVVKDLEEEQKVLVEKARLLKVIDNFHGFDV